MNNNINSTTVVNSNKHIIENKTRRGNERHFLAQLVLAAFNAKDDRYLRLYIICTYFNDSKNIKYSDIPALAEISGLSERNIQDTFRQMAKAGWGVIERSKKDHKKKSFRLKSEIRIIEDVYSLPVQPAFMSVGIPFEVVSDTTRKTFSSNLMMMALAMLSRDRTITISRERLGSIVNRSKATMRQYESEAMSLLIEGNSDFLTKNFLILQLLPQNTSPSQLEYYIKANSIKHEQPCFAIPDWRNFLGSGGKRKWAICKQLPNTYYISPDMVNLGHKKLTLCKEMSELWHNGGSLYASSKKGKGGVMSNDHTSINSFAVNNTPTQRCRLGDKLSLVNNTIHSKLSKRLSNGTTVVLSSSGKARRVDNVYMNYDDNGLLTEVVEHQTMSSPYVSLTERIYSDSEKPNRKVKDNEEEEMDVRESGKMFHHATSRSGGRWHLSHDSFHINNNGVREELVMESFLHHPNSQNCHTDASIDMKPKCEKSKERSEWEYIKKYGRRNVHEFSP